jgi:hypothetical protein
MRNLIIISITILLSSCSQNTKYREIASSSIVSCITAINNFPRVKAYELGEIRPTALENFDAELHVTQFLYGRPGVINRKRELRSLDFEELLEYLEQKPVPYVPGPDGMKYIIDRHHFTRSLFELKEEFAQKFPERFHEIQVHYQEVTFEDLNPADLSHDEFINLMKENKLTYLKKPNGMGDFNKLPDSIGGLKEDYFRGLSWLVRKSGAYEKTDIPFAEFYWGEYFKKTVQIDEYNFSKSNIKKAIKAALEYSEENSHLPGFKGHLGMGKEERKELVKKYMKKLKKKELLNLDEFDF